MTKIAETVNRFPAGGQKLLQTVVRYLLMILLAFTMFGVILLIAGKDPLASYKDIFSSTLGSARGFSEVIVSMIPMLITALAVALPFRVGLINIGGEGQLYIGAAFATFGALTFSNLPAWLLLPLMALLGMLGGALWAFIPGYLKAIGLVNETITSLLLNSVAPKIIGFLILGFWHSPRDTVKTPRFCRCGTAADLFWDAHPSRPGDRTGFVDRLLARHEIYPLGTGNARHRQQSPGCQKKWHPAGKISGDRHVPGRCDRRSGGHGPGLRVLRNALSQLLHEHGFHGLHDLLAGRWLTRSGSS